MVNLPSVALRSLGPVLIDLSGIVSVLILVCACVRACVRAVANFGLDCNVLNAKTRGGRVRDNIADFMVSSQRLSYAEVSLLKCLMLT